MNNLNILSKGLKPLTVFIFLLLSCPTYAQNSPWSLVIGYEQVYVSPKTTGNLAEKDWIWNDPNRGELFTMRTSRTHAMNLGLRYDIFKWWSVTGNFKQYYRRYYVWSGTYLSEEWEGHQPGQFKIVPYVEFLNYPSMFLGRTLRTISWQVGTEFSHIISKNRKWKLHYFVSLNRDQYEVDLDAFDTSIDYGVNRTFYTTPVTNKRVDFQLDGKFKLKSYNPGRSGYQGSTNIGIALSRNFKNGMGLRFEFGFRNLLWTKNLQLEENHWELNLEYTEYKEGTDFILYKNRIVHEFPLEIGGYYNSLSFTFRPFRSKRDNPNYVKKKWRLIPKFLRKS